nr:MAG TPA: hypothetical protein [Caudoviricetes sp.]
MRSLRGLYGGSNPSSPVIRKPRELSHDWLKTWGF